jgi:hypothetical protein
MTKSRLVLLVFFMFIEGCQPKSEIDKCVDAIAIQFCNQRLNSSLEKFYEGMGLSENQCIRQHNEQFGGDTRKECLKAQTGKD